MSALTLGKEHHNHILVKPHAQLLCLALRERLQDARREAQIAQARNTRGTLIQIPRTGRKIASAYEHLRNAAEYTEEHLLLQRAIRRFYKRDIFLARRRLDGIGEDLIIELTLAGYLHNNTVGTETAAAIHQVTTDYLRVYGELRQAGIGRDQATTWVLDILSVEAEEILNPHGHLTALAYVAYQHYLRLLPRNKLVLAADEDSHYEVGLYVAVHLALLKSDIAIIRHDLMKTHIQDPHQTREFIEFNQVLSEHYTSAFTQRLKRTISRYGAPLRVLKGMVEDRTDMIELLADKEVFLEAYVHQTGLEYRSAKQRLDRGVRKSIIFLFITKGIIGLAIEVPYDLLIIGHIAVLPLAVNLLFPPFYIASVGLIQRLPPRTNTGMLREYIDQALFSLDLPPQDLLRLGPKPISAPAQILYGIFLLAPIASIIALLNVLGFTIVQEVVFFIFLSTASFLGFHLSRIIRDLELATKPSGLLSTMSDFFYLPFIVIGQWLSGKYAQVNAGAFFLDMAIELPLKSALRLIHQGTRFLNDRRDDIY